MSKPLQVFLSADPNQQFPRKILEFPLIKGIRLNTGAPINGSKIKILKDFKDSTSPVKMWIDLKCRELRLVKDAVIPRDHLQLNHEISVNTPTELWYNEGKNYVIIDKVIDGNKIIIKTPENYSGKENIRFGKGASFNITDNSLKIHGYLTENDIEYIKAATQIGLHDYFLSYVESLSDINDLWELDPEANIFGKIESQKGLEFVEHDYSKVKDKIQLIIARADLYIELDRPHEILNAIKLIIKENPDAIAASRLLESFLDLKKIPKCVDFTDLGYLLELGYYRFLLGDEICQNNEALSSALGVLNIIKKELI